MDITSTEHEETLTNKNVYTLHAYYEISITDVHFFRA